MSKVSKSDLYSVMDQVLEVMPKDERNIVLKEMNNFSLDMGEILDYYDRKNGTNLQNELKSEIKDTSYEKMMKVFHDKNEQDENQRDEGVDVTQEIKEEVEKTGVSKDDVDTKQIQENLKQKSIEDDEKDIEQTKSSIRLSVIECVYETTLEKYMAFRDEIEKSQLKHDELSLPSGPYNKILEYEKYLKTLDINYNMISGKNIAKQNPKIAKMENELENDRQDTKTKVLKKDEKQFIKIKELSNIRDEILQEIAQLSANNKLYPPDKLNEKMDELQKRLVEKNQELRSLSPNPLELQREQLERKKEERIRESEVGAVYISEKENQVEQKSVNEKKEEKQQKAIDVQNHEILENNIDAVEELGKQFDKALLSGEKDITKLRAIVENMKSINGNTEDIASDKRDLAKDGKYDGGKENQSSIEENIVEEKSNDRVTGIQADRENSMGINNVQDREIVELIAQKNYVLNCSRQSRIGNNNLRESTGKVR